MKKIIGLIVEYNPFHNGHLYHIKQIEKLYPNSLKIAVMSGDFVQRGEAAIVSKNRRAKKAIEMGVDIVIELPAFYSTQSAEIFSRSAVRILNILGCEAFVFGSERGNIEELKKIGALTLDIEFNLEMKKYLSEGFSYPTAFSKILENKNMKTRIEANDILGIEYIKALSFWKSDMKAVTVLRKSSKYYEENPKENIAGATIIRKKIVRGQDYKNYLPQKITIESPFIFWKDLYPYLRYSILFNREKLKNIQDMEKGLDIRIYNAAKTNKDYSKFLEAILTKRYTNARLKRVLIHILIGLTKDITEKWKNKIPYIRILEFNSEGQKYLNQIKKIEFPLISTKKNIKKNLTEEEREIFFWNERASDFYNWLAEEKK